MLAFIFHLKPSNQGLNTLVTLVLEGLLVLGLDIVDTSNHVEGVLGDVVVLTLEDLLESGDSLLEGDKTTLNTGENVGDSERLGHESLDLTGTLDSELVLLGQLVHTKNGNDILERLVRLQDLLRSGGDAVVTLTNDSGVQHTGLGVERVDGGVDTQLGDTTGQDSGGVQVGEGGGRGGIGQIIGWDVDGLDGSDRTLVGGGTASQLVCSVRELGYSHSLLHHTHIGGKGRLVSDSGRDTTQKGRHLGTGLGESENVVNEKQDILSLLITEVFGDGETGKGDTGTSTWGLVHLTED